MNYQYRVKNITDHNFVGALPKTFSNECYLFNSQIEIGDEYKSSYSLKYVIDGYEEYTINGAPICLSSGQGLLVNNSNELRVRSKGKSIAFFLSSDLMDVMYKKLSKDRKVFFMNESHIELNSIPETLIKLIRQIAKAQNALVDYSFYRALAEYFILLHWKNLNSVSPLYNWQKANTSFIVERLYVALDFILRNSNQRITIEDIASEAAISKFHLIRSFRAHFGITPIQLHLLCKIDKAKDMLIENPRLKIKDVATFIGYPDVFSFSKHFKKVTGFSPACFLPGGSVKSELITPVSSY